MLGDAEDAVGAPHVLADEGHVVRPDLGGDHLGVLEEEQVVNGHDRACPCPPGTMSGVGRVDEIEGRARRGGERGPAEPVPGEVERPTGQAAVDEPDVRRPVARGEAILERRARRR